MGAEMSAIIRRADYACCRSHPNGAGRPAFKSRESPSSVSTRGGQVVVSITVPFVDLRAQARELHDEFFEVFESVPSRAAGLRRLG